MSDVAGDNLIGQVSPDFFIIWSDSRSGNPEECTLIHHEQICSYFQYNKALHQKEGDPLDVPAGSSTATLDAILPFSNFTDPTGYLTHNPSNITVDLVGIDVAINGLEEGYEEGYNGVADAEGEDDTMEQGDDAENARGVA
ncbi:hypothetical protein M404DRAFT_19896 [Pisolithus tinctorius Marx 270]|uniref:Uncharacterized protein n=1 Tax=Pisolithus tinctorius Marx 270 TaxID=870435 RepID=A0A0C3KRA3_PISTI|nr:hypothetical protein M404DRAFT_19896 [Pisolithus tinctorius Marx 270]